MKSRRPDQPKRPKQQTPEEVLDALLGLVQRKFYAGHAVEFAKDRQRLLQWCILWPAREWFDEKSITIPAEKYREILATVIVDAAAHQTGDIHYIPAWLKQTIQSHFRIHGEDYYNAAKAIRAQSEHILLNLGKQPAKPQNDIVKTFTAASKLLDRPKRVKATAVTPGKQLNLLDV